VALEKNETGSRNTAVGEEALAGNTTASGNTAVGSEALKTCQSGHSNSAVGNFALQDLTTATNCTAIGKSAGADITTGASNVAVGSFSLLATTTSSNNTAVGVSALTAVTTGSGLNTGIGVQAGADVTTGVNNLLLGFNAGRSSSPSGLIDAEDNKVCLGNNSITDLFCKVSTIQTSDIRDKTDINDFTHGLSWVEKLRPITYRWDMRSNYIDGKPNGSKKETRINLGFIAQEVLEIEKEHGFATNKDMMLLVNENSDGNYGMKYDRVVPILVNAIKELSAKVTALEAR